MLRWDWVRITMTVEEQQQFANQRLCTSPLHNLLRRKNIPKLSKEHQELEDAYQSTQVGKDEVLATSKS